MVNRGLDARGHGFVVLDEVMADVLRVHVEVLPSHSLRYSAIY
jgi:hypothetical protein